MLMHDHTPHHGGVVGMVGDRHVEALALADGTVRVYLTDRWRKPLQFEHVDGTVTIESGDAPTKLPLRREADALEARAAAPTSATVEARIDLRVDDAPLSVEFLLPIGARSGGAAGVPLEGCVASVSKPAGRRSPRCTLAFSNEVTALATTPDAKRLLLAAADVGTSVWALPEVKLELGWEAPPPLVMEKPEAPHREAANAVVASPDSTEAVLALEGRLLVYSVADGKVLREIGPGRGVVRDVDWSSDGRLLVVARFYDRKATLIRADDGSLVRELALDDEISAVAFDREGRIAAVGSRRGEIVLFDVTSAKRVRTLRAGSRAVEAIVFAQPSGESDLSRLWSVGVDGALRSFDVQSGDETTMSGLGLALHRIAISLDHGVIATGDRFGSVRLHDLDGKTIETLTSHREGASVLDLAFAGANLVASDSLGIVSVWDLGASLAPLGPSN
jgi:WD40 repeat protein